MPKKIFSLQEANALLPQLEIIIVRLLKKKESHDRQHDALFMHELLHEATKHSSVKEDETKHLHAGASDVDGVFDLEEDLKAIRALGCVLRSLERGWVEFPAEREGQPVYWCWKKGEREVGHYRPISTAALDRFPL